MICYKSNEYTIVGDGWKNDLNFPLGITCTKGKYLVFYSINAQTVLNGTLLLCPNITSIGGVGGGVKNNDFWQMGAVGYHDSSADFNQIIINIYTSLGLGSSISQKVTVYMTFLRLIRY